MTIEAPTLDTLDPSLVQSTADSTAQQLAEYDPRLDVTRGAIYDVLVWFHSLVSSQNTTLLLLYLASRSLTTIKADPATANDDMVTDIVANFGVDRLPSVPARGDVTIVRNTDVPLVIPVGSVFFAGALRFVTETVFSAHNDEADVVTTNDRLITQVDNDSFAFTISVVCETSGTVGMLREDALLTPEVIPSGFVSAYAAGDFRGGRDMESNEDLIERLEAGTARPSFASRPAMRALLRQQENLADFIHDSAVGAGDAEMRRDRRYLVPVGVGGRVDWYVRTDEVATKTLLVKTAVLAEKETTSGGAVQGIWRFTIDRDDLPAFYELLSVVPHGSALGGSFVIRSQTRGIDTTSLGEDAHIPDISVVSDGLYSRYQNATIDFVDTVTDVTAMSIGDTADYDVMLIGISRIATIQDDLASNGSIAHPGADCLVRAPFPCWVKIDLGLRKQETDPSFDTGAIKDAVVRAVNRTGFTGRLFVADLVAAAYSVLGGNGKISYASARGRLVTSDGQTLHFDSNTVIEIPNLPLQGISYRTVQFFTSLDDISISEETNIPSPR